MPYNLEFWAFQTAAMLLTALLLPGLKVSGPIPAFVTVLVLALFNTYLWDAALFFNVPNSLSSNTLALLGVNAAIFWIVVKVLPGIEIEGIFPALAAPIVFTVTSVLIQRYGRDVDWMRVFNTVVEYFGVLKGYFQQDSAKAAKGALLLLRPFTGYPLA